MVSKYERSQPGDVGRRRGRAVPNRKIIGRNRGKDGHPWSADADLRAKGGESREEITTGARGDTRYGLRVITILGEFTKFTNSRDGKHIWRGGRILDGSTRVTS